MIRFVLNGVTYELSRAVLESRLTRHSPEPGVKHVVDVNGTWYPVLQAFEVALGVSRTEFCSHTARRHLANLGYEVRGDIEPRGTALRVVRSPASAPAEDERWHSEAAVQDTLVAWLVNQDWQIISVANTAAKEHGVDVIAARGATTAGFEVKGYPSRSYADPRRAHEIKKTAPSNQAGHWFAQAILAAMRLRGREPDWKSAIALPDFPRYRDLYAQTSASLLAAEIEVYWVRSDRTVEAAR